MWLEAPDGVRVADAKIQSSDATRIDFVFETDVPSGKYRFAVGFREGDGAAVLKAEIPVKVVSI